jgi:hypothetical protein
MRIRASFAAMAIAGLALAGCGSLSTTDAIECTAALIATGSTSATELAAAALAAPSCQALAKDALDAAIKSVQKKNLQMRMQR